LNSRLRNILIEKSKEYKFPLHSARLYSQLTETEKVKVNFITDNIGTEKAELIYNPENASQVIITLNHLITKENKIHLSQIINLRTNEYEQKDVKEKFDRMVYKFELTKWVIGLRNGSSIEIELKKGRAYYSFYHILQKLLRAKGYWN